MKYLPVFLSFKPVHFWALCCLVLQLLPQSLWAESNPTVRQFHSSLPLSFTDIQNLFLKAHPKLLTQDGFQSKELENLNSQFLTYNEQLIKLEKELEVIKTKAHTERKKLDSDYQADIEILSAEATYLGIPFSDILEEVSFIPSYPEEFEDQSHTTGLENNPKYAHLKSKIEDLKLSVYMKNLFFSIANNSIRHEQEEMERKIFILKNQRFKLENTYTFSTKTFNYSATNLMHFLDQKSYGLCNIKHVDSGLEFQVIEAQNKPGVRHYYNQSINNNLSFNYEVKRKPFFSWFAKAINPKINLIGDYKLKVIYTYDINKNLIAINFDIILHGQFKFGENQEKLWPNLKSQFRVLSFELTPKHITQLINQKFHLDELINAKVLLPLFTGSSLDTESLCLDY